MENNLMTIRQMRDRFDVTARTLRFYETKELLSPIREGQKRLFTKRDQARLTLILRGKRFGFSLEDIRQLLDLYDLGDQRLTQMEKTYDLAQARLVEMQEQQRALNETIDELKERLQWGATLIAETKQQTAA